MSKLLCEVVGIQPQPILVKYGRSSRLLLEGHQSLKILKAIASVTGVDMTAIGSEEDPVNVAVTTRPISRAQLDLFEAGIDGQIGSEFSFTVLKVDKKTGEIQDGGDDVPS